MTDDQIVRMIYAGAIGGLCAVAFDDVSTGLLVGIAIIILASLIGALLGSDK